MSFPGGGGAGFFGGGDAIGFGGIRIGAITNGLKAQMREAERDITSALNQTAGKAETSARRTSKAWESALGFAKVAAVGTGIAIAGGLAASAQAAISFESAFAGVRKTVDFGNISAAESEKRFKALSDEFRGLAKEIPIGVNELAAIGEQAGALGVAAGDIKEFTRVAALIGVTTNVSADQAATALGQLTNVLGLTNEDYERFASTLVGLGNKGASTEAQILEMASRAGGAAKLVGLGADATLGWASAVADLGIEVEAGGSSLQNFFLKAQKAMTVTKDLKVMAGVAGVSTKAFKRAFEKDASGALTTFVQGLGKLSAGKQLEVLGSLGFDDIRMSRMLLGLAGKSDGLTGSLKNASAAWKENTALQEEAEKRFATTASQMQLLSNVVKDLFIGIGEVLLPGINAVVRGLTENLPKAAKFLEGIWNTILGPAVGRVAEAFGNFWDVIRNVFGSGDEALRFSDVLGGAMSGLAKVMGTVLDVTAGVLDVLTKLMSNPVIAGLAKVAGVIAAVAVAFSGARFAVDKLNGASKGFLRLLTGGRLGADPTGKGGVDPGSTALKGAASELGQSAVQLEAAARSLKGAASTQRGAAAGGLPVPDGRGAGGIRNGGPGPMGGPMQMVGKGDPGGIGRIGDRIGFTSVTNDAATKAYWERNQRRLAAFGQGVMRETVARVGDSVAAAGRGIRRLPATAMRGLHTAASLFWPLAIAGIGVSLVQAPIGAFVAKNTQFKRAGEKMKEDFFGGLFGLVQSWKLGSDLFLDLPTISLGGKDFRTQSLPGLDVTPEEVERLTAGGLEGLLAQQEIGPRVIAKLQQTRDEDVYEWSRRIRKALEEAGLSTTAIDENLDQWRFTDEDRARLNPALVGAVQSGISQMTQGVFSNIGKGISTEVVAALRSWSSGRIKVEDIIKLPPDTYKSLAELMVLDAKGAIDPRVLNLAISGLLDAPTPSGPVDMKGYPKVQDRAEEMGAPYQQKARSEGLLSQIVNDQAHLTKYLKDLTDTPDKAKIQTTSKEALAFLEAGTKGKDAKSGAGFLKQINASRALSGWEKFSWEQLIDWQAELSEATGTTWQRKLNKRMKKWSVAAAASGAEGGAAKFTEAWAAQIAAADTTKEKAALRDRLNDLIPGTANDIPKGKFGQWLKDVQAAAEEETKPTAVESMIDFVGNLLSDPKGAIEKLTADLKATFKGGIGAAIVDEGLIAILAAAGYKLVRAIASGATSAKAKDAMATAASAALHEFKDHLPQSPVRKGPLKHPFLFKAGENMVRQIGLGMRKSSLSLPPLDMESATGAGARGAGGRGVTIYADKLQTFGPADERSLTGQLEFLAADGR